ncbi:pyruvate kinase [Anaerocolumna chitinilytica]|uniref:Pyruvate kinase n=1 Tax=Anaerocolumna chitinilytica TaxID=1727145 RepID=A0A7I8DM02_9FIRM|nr:pyruvate kinase [Anaerocolumna chitinilytica]BCJ99400.1 pyruvate kinase [Anaerocolumna chitinilytica]
MRKTKIICTLGPSTDKGDVMRELALAGMDCARFNFSHADHEEHYNRLVRLRQIREELDIPIAALLDTKGPEIRIGKFTDKRIELVKGQTFTLTTRHIEGTNECVYINYEHLVKDVNVGSTILIDDGLVELTVEELTDTDIICTVKNDGAISDNKGVNVPGTKLTMPFISAKDRDDIIFAIENGYDFIAASFTRNAADIMEIRKIMAEYNCTTTNIIAKIENMEGVENIDEIIDAADGIMIARGDMGVEIPLEDVPVIQKMIIKKVYNAGKQVITATQMLDSMMKNPRPTRAEATDVANAIYDGTSAIMLSGETAAGLYPVDSLKTMVRIAIRTEQDIDYKKRFKLLEAEKNPSITDAISHATCTTAHDLNAAVIITVTKSGQTARMISKYRPSCPIIGCTTEQHVCRQLNLSWGVKPLMIKEEQDTFVLFDHAISKVEGKGYLHDGELTVITAGVPLRTSGTTNIIKVHIAGSHFINN